MFPNKQLTVPMPGIELESVDMVGEWEWDSGTTTIGYSKAVVRAGRVGRRRAHARVSRVAGGGSDR